MWSFYATALIPVIAGAFLWIHSRRITFSEWMKGSVLGFAIAAGYHAYTAFTLTVDFETVSGRAIAVTHCPECVIERGDETEPLREHWTVTLDFGEDILSFEIPAEEFEQLREQFGGELRRATPRDFRPIDDDYRVETCDNETGILIPGHSFRMSKRRAQSGPSLLSFTEPPDDLPLHDYPTGMNESNLRMFVAGSTALQWTGSSSVPAEAQLFDWRQSTRLLGGADNDFGIDAWDKLNAEIALETGANLIAIRYDSDSSIAQWQEAKWRGGKKNDLVLCYGAPRESGRPTWTYCFGWSEDELVRRNLESILLNASIGDALLPSIKQEILSNYRPRYWPPINYLSIPPPAGALSKLVLLMLVMQGGFWTIAYRNRSRRKAADAGEHAEVEEERVRELQQARDRSDLKRIRKEMPNVDPKDIDALIATLTSGTSDYHACLALRRLEDPRVATGMVIGLTSTKFRAREMAGQWLDEHVDKPTESEAARAATEILIDRLRHRDPTTRSEARRILDAIAPKWPATEAGHRNRSALLSELDQAIHDRQPLARPKADALSAHGTLAARPLLSRLEEACPDVAIDLLPILGGTRDHDAILALSASLSDSDTGKRGAAMDGLGRCGGALEKHPSAAEIWDSLQAALKLVAKEDPSVSHGLSALAALRDLRGEEFTARFLGHGDPSLRRVAVKTLGAIGSAESVPRLFRRTTHSKSTETLDLVKALGGIGDESIIPLLLELFEEKKGGGTLVLETIVHALFPLGDPDLESLLEHERRDPHSGIDDLANTRLRQLRAGFQSPGWDLTATAWKDRLGQR